MNDSTSVAGAARDHLPLGDRALVLGGGGSAGNAWLIGLLAGLQVGGLDVTDADLVVGTSAGATAAAQLGGADPARLYADILDAEPLLAARRDDRPPQGRPGMSHLERTDAVIAASPDAAAMRRRIGADARELADPATSERWRAMVAARLPSPVWPDRRVVLTAVDADTGEPVLFDRDSGVDLVDAVAASCAGGPAYAIGDRYLVDGGYRTNADNADVASGYRRVLVLSPLGGRSRLPRAWGLHLSDQVAVLKATGSSVETIVPDAASLAAFGGDLMDLTTRAPAARAAFAQGHELAPALEAFWR